MQTFPRILAVLITVGLAAEAGASGAGGAIYVPRAVKQASHMSPHADCEACGRIGFAGVDPSTPAPCTAEGGCHPNRGTYGWSPTRWRPWPGTNYGGPTPERAQEPDPVLDVIELPAPEEEDQQAPPPIEDAETPGGEVIEDAVEAPNPAGVIAPPPIELPPLPRPGQGRPLPPSPLGAPGEGPPALPFGDFRPAAPSEPKDSGWRKPSRLPVVVRKRADEDRPPALPRGLTRSNPDQLLRRLPTVAPGRVRVDAAVLPASMDAPQR